MRIATVACALVIVGLLLATAPAAAQQGSQGTQPALQGSSALQGFSLVLVLGDLQGGATAPDNIPAAARAALGDLKDFLPYKSYRLLDTAWILGSTTQLFRATSRLRGAEEQTYEIALTSSPVGAPAPSLQVKFVMRETGGEAELRGLNPAHPAVIAAERRLAREAQLKAELLELLATRAALEKDLQNSNFTGSVEDRKARVTQGQQQMRDLQIAIDTRQNELRASGGGGQTLIDTSFNMRIGETVVVGTSRVRGDKALIALLTAVRK